MSLLEYIRKFDQLSRYAPHMVATEDLKKDNFMQGLCKDLAKDLKVAGVRDASDANKTLKPTLNLKFQLPKKVLIDLRQTKP